jgi:hypothetical protein
MIQGPQLSYIYGLKDPRDGLVYYVGKSNDPDTRLIQHLEKRSNPHKIAWIESLEAEGLTPELVILETVDRANWKESERYWIALGREEGWPLTNILDGGEGSDAFVGPSYEFLRGYIAPEQWPAFEALGIRERDALCVKMAQAMVAQPFYRRDLQVLAGRDVARGYLGCVTTSL